MGYVEDGPNLVTMAMNGWGEAEPAWWLNLQDNPLAIVQTRDGTRQVRARRIVVFHVARQHMTQMPLPEHDDVVKALPADRADQTLSMAVLPW